MEKEGDMEGKISGTKMQGGDIKREEAWYQKFTREEADFEYDMTRNVKTEAGEVIVEETEERRDCKKRKGRKSREGVRKYGGGNRGFVDWEKPLSSQSGGERSSVVGVGVGD